MERSIAVGYCAVKCHCGWTYFNRNSDLCHLWLCLRRNNIIMMNDNRWIQRNNSFRTEVTMISNLGYAFVSGGYVLLKSTPTILSPWFNANINSVCSLETQTILSFPLTCFLFPDWLQANNNVTRARNVNIFFMLKTKK